MWGRGAVTRFDGRTPDAGSEPGTGGAPSLDGEVTNAMQGTDWQRGRRTTGLVVAHNLGEGGDSGGEDGGGRTSATLTGLYPWLHHALSDRLEAWGEAGYGAGSLTLEPHFASEPRSGVSLRTDMDVWMAAAGLRGTLVEPGSGSGGIGGLFDSLMLTGKTDAMIVGTSTDAVPGSGTGGRQAAADAQVSRLRLGLEGSLPLRPGDGAVLTSGFELGVRHDGGDAEKGFRGGHRREPLLDGCEARHFGGVQGTRPVGARGERLPRARALGRLLMGPGRGRPGTASQADADAGFRVLGRGGGAPRAHHAGGAGSQ